MERFIVLGVLSFSLASGAQTFEKNVPKDIRDQIVADLKFVGSIDGKETSALFAQIFGSLKGTDQLKWFRDRIKKIGLNSCGGPQSNAVACVIPMMGWNRMFLTENYIKYSHPQVARLMVLFHEARHTEATNRFWGHATCPVPFRHANGTDVRSIWTGVLIEGEPACDVTPFGSYGSSTILLKNIARYCTTCSEKVRMDAALYAGDQINRLSDIQVKNEVWNDSFLEATQN